MLAGKEILKTVRVHDAKIVDETNLRAAALSYADSHARQREGLGIHDVKWSHGQFSSHIATAAANGKVILYDLNRASVELTRLHEHSRQVHKLAFNPHQGHLLLSASHDATVRLWDLRDMRRDVSTCRSRDQYAGINGGIRDVLWSPTDAVEFAFGTDNGNIQRWDFRHNKSPKQKITAHERTCTSIDWHPDGKHLLSSGVDRTVKVWDFSIDGRRQKAVWVLTTPYPVHKARWRPPYWSNESYEEGVYQSTQLATSYDRDHSAIHIWDFRRPYLPFREINRSKTAPSDMLWHSRDILWTVGKEGIFRQNDVHHAPKTVDRRNLQALAVSPIGEVVGVAQKRPRRQRSAASAYPEDTYIGDSHNKRSVPEKDSLQGSADDGLGDNFLTASLKQRHGRTASNRSVKSFRNTLPSDAAPKVMFLTDSMTTKTDFTKPNQLAIRGPLPGSVNNQVFAYLAHKYKAIPLTDPPDLDSFLDIERVFQQNANYAQRAAFHRLAQTWQLVGSSIASATRRRAELHRERRRLRHKPAPLGLSGIKHKTSVAQDKHFVAPPNPAVRAILGVVDRSQATSPAGPSHTNVESTSNLTTPLARPITAHQSISSDAHKPTLPDIDHDDLIQLPPAANAPQANVQSSRLRPDITNKTLSPTQSTFNGPHWYQSSDDLDERRAMVGSWRASPRIPLTLGPTNTQGTNSNIPPPLERHHSGESFTMFSASTDSQHGNSIPSSFASGNSQSARSLTKGWQRTPEKSSFGRPQFATNHNQQRDLDTSMQISPNTVPIHTNEFSGVAALDHSTQSDSAHNGTDHLAEFSSDERVVQEMESLRRNNQLLRHDSSESEAYISSRDGASTSSIDYSADMEASGTIVPEVLGGMRSPYGSKPPPSLFHATKNVIPIMNSTDEDALQLLDFQAIHVDAEEGSAFSVVGLLNNLLAFHTTTHSDAQFPSLLLLLLAPLLPQTHTPSGDSEIDAGEVLTAFADTFTSLGLTPAQAKAILSTQLSQLIATGINPYQAESILHTYHAQLHSLCLYNSAASLRRLAYPTYPAVYDQALKDTQLGLLCLSCNTPINNPKDKMRCESCKRAQAPCAICWGRFPALEPDTGKRKEKFRFRTSVQEKRNQSSLVPNIDLGSGDNHEELSPTIPSNWSPSKATLWTWCPLCGHGGHTNCISTWFSDPVFSEGACPTEGCLCDCVNGKRREDRLEEALRKKAEKSRAKPVRKGDDWKVHESKAVSAVRSALDDPKQSLPRKDEPKRVRVVAPDQTLASQFGAQKLPRG